MTDDCQQRIQAAAYLLGALTAQEAERYREHLLGCPSCREEIAQLQPAVDALAEATPPMQMPEALFQRVMTTVSAEAKLIKVAGTSEKDRSRAGRRLSWRIAALTATALLIAAVIIGVSQIGSTSTSTQRVTQAVVATHTRGAHAEVRQTGTKGELVVSHFPQAPAGKVYQVWLARANQAPTPTNALFAIAKNGSASVDVPGNLHSVHQVLVTAEPTGGSPHPTSTPVIVATLPVS